MYPTSGTASSSTEPQRGISAGPNNRFTRGCGDTSPEEGVTPSRCLNESETGPSTWGQEVVAASDDATGHSVIQTAVLVAAGALEATGTEMDVVEYV